MACRLPVVSTTVTGIPEMVAHGETGLLVEPMDEEAMACAIAELGNDPERRRQMGDAGRRRADEFSMPFALAVCRVVSITLPWPSRASGMLIHGTPPFQ